MEHGDHWGHRGSPAPLGRWSDAPYAPLCFARADQGVRRGTPFTRRSLPSQDKATGTRACKLHEASRHELAATPLRIEQGAHPLSR
jgi:hypothetical protein